MSVTRFALIAAALLVLPLALPGAALANTVGTPIIADLNNDGLLDRVVLGTSATTPTCTLTLEKGKKNGTYAAPVTHTYTSPWPRAPYCPNMGVAINLGPLRQMELVLTHFNFSGASNSLLVLKDYDPVVEFAGLAFPSAIGTTDFDGDGRTDVYESTDEEQTLSTYRNTASGTLVPGPFSVCSIEAAPQLVQADFNGDGGTDFLAEAQCHGVSTAQVLFGNAQAPAVLATAGRYGAYRVFSTDVDNDGVPDAGVIEYTGGQPVAVHLFHNDGSGGFTELPLSPAARTAALSSGLGSVAAATSGMRHLR